MSMNATSDVDQDAMRVANRYAAQISKHATLLDRADACRDAATLYQRDARASAEAAQTHRASARTIRDPDVAAEHERQAQAADAEARLETLAARHYEMQAEVYQAGGNPQAPADVDILTGPGQRAITAPIGAPAMTSPQTTPRSRTHNPDQPRAADGTWTKVGDVLGYIDEETCFGTDKVAGAGTAATILALMDFEDDADGNGGRYVAVATPRSGDWNPLTSIEAPTPDDLYGPASSYMPPHLDADEALAAAAHLDELAELATSGYQPPKPTRSSRAAQRLQHLVDADRTDLDESIGIGDDENFPLTVRELLAILHDQDQAGAQASTRRKVTAAASGAAGGETGVLWMDLDRADDGTLRITVVGVESETENPDDDYWKPYVTEYTPESARELATKLRTFARAARTRAAR